MKKSRRISFCFFLFRNCLQPVHRELPENVYAYIHKGKKGWGKADKAYEPETDTDTNTGRKKNGILEAVRFWTAEVDVWTVRKRYIKYCHSDYLCCFVYCGTDFLAPAFSMAFHGAAAVEFFPDVFPEHCSQIQRKPGFLQLFPKACRSVSPKRPEHKGPAASVLFLPEVQKYAAGAQGKGKAGNHLPGMRESVCPKKLKGESKADSKRTEDFHNPPFFYGFAFFKCVTGSKRLPHTPGSRLQWGWGRSLFSGNNRKQRI